MNDRIINWNLDPVIFWITESFPLKYYGLFFMIGILLAFYVEKRIYAKENIPIENLDKLFIYVVVGILLGARLGHCLFYDPSYYFANPLEILLPIKKIGDSYQFIGFQGLASHGGTIGVLIAIGIYCKKYKTNFLSVLDKISIVAPIVAAFIRFGNFMNSEIYGKPTNGNWGVVFQRDDLIPRHPTQLYEAFSYLLIFGILVLIYKKKKEKSNGLILGLALVLIFLARFIIEFFKENQVDFESGMLINMGQILSVPFIIIGLILILARKKPSVQHSI
ncbi:prolipoprotein diacylglyceryl transferase [Subsaximicrobium wynnwilliamsii]|jgi:prolipoprotein diacylglyceryl transferase|uniref:Phosphatidylglycerol--prolipoprotein diacylglyceryl transferase n=2 Tax=Flavobacteriaceae TaxID=49546 RepID=A0A5C6Z9U7_9FLAO|nr:MULTISPECIES: prolipoprotein diacylglyceryl transferase [Flavobacteriaceae]EHQ04167.1 Prolipoprotein diacylglyceryl transferase [Gillisia limnaea DSM 15749]TXD83546.1 prolipoprotein diacylglyceryl transferase [Subsaximicrobium wynnwilliamsii]TXD86204.1 prolipoprotein diacylglyceryl transferase [Subsaximicrobium wynnwilliamsii]TXE03226.1 prolipoprotein diacylglyceryl transferase [Subsaximicrobium wynnwilliamsii]